MPVAVPVGLHEGVTDEVLDEEEPPEGVADPVLLPLATAPVVELLPVRVTVSVLDCVRVPDGVPDGVTEGVSVGDGVPVVEAPLDSVAVTEGVWEGVGNITPTT